MDILLTESEVRVLASLMEKELATPEYYPLTLNALLNACNQKTSRDPVVNYDEETVLDALAGLKTKRLVWETAVGRVPKYEETIINNRNMMRGEAAALCSLMLRGPQTLGEIKNVSERLYAFHDLDEANGVINSLMEMEYAAKLPRLPGHKESRYCHLLAGEPLLRQEAPAPGPHAHFSPSTERIAQLEEEIRGIKEELDSLKAAFRDFKKQFE